MRLYVSNLPYSVTKDALLGVFAEYGCSGADIVRDRATGRPRGYAFVEVETEPTRQMVYRGRRLWISGASQRPSQ